MNKSYHLIYEDEMDHHHTFLLKFFFIFFLQNIQLPLEPQTVIQKDLYNINNQLDTKNDLVDETELQILNNINLVNKNVIVDKKINDYGHHGAVTATPKPPTTVLDDIFISVKTTKNYHDTRLALIIKTWFQLAKGQVSFYIFFLFIFIYFN